MNKLWEEINNIVQFFGLYTSPTEVALVLELASGGDCQQLLKRHGPLSEAAALSIASQLCEALFSPGLAHAEPSSRLKNSAIRCSR